jgi:hypothetical protein
LACPAPVLEPTDVYLVPHHGNEDVNVPPLLTLLHPRVAVLNNAPAKGGAAATLAALRDQAPAIDVWQLHRSSTAGPANTRDDLIANLDDPDAGVAIEIEAHADGRFTVTNRRNGFARAYER